MECCERATDSCSSSGGAGSRAERAELGPAAKILRIETGSNTNPGG